MQVKIADNAGFCFGVKRALDKIEEYNNGKLFVLGKLIHNPQVVEELEKKGIRSIEDTKSIKKGSRIVITAHGISDKKIEELKKQEFEVIDLTCPLVKKVHNITKGAEKEGYKIIIFGDEKHVEVKGIKDNLKDAIVISNSSDFEKLDPKENYMLVSQTTQNVDKFNKIAKLLGEVLNYLKVYDTICMPTKERQKSSIDLSKESDVMIVVGGKMSANTIKLTQRCSEFTKTYHIETAEELDKLWFKDAKKVGITAGASTPDNIIKDVAKRIKDGF